MNVVDADIQRRESNFGGVRLQLHPGGMGGGADRADVWHEWSRRVEFSL
jgi:hypothetical protein